MTVLEILYQQRLLIRKALEHQSRHLHCLASEGTNKADLLAQAAEAEELAQQFKDASKIVLHFDD